MALIENVNCNPFFLDADGRLWELTPDGPVDYLKEESAQGFVRQQDDAEFMASLGVKWP